jgi:hypothetical protein
MLWDFLEVGTARGCSTEPRSRQDRCLQGIFSPGSRLTRHFPSSWKLLINRRSASGHHLRWGVHGQPTSTQGRAEKAPGTATLPESQEAWQQPRQKGEEGRWETAPEGQAATGRPASQNGFQARSGERLDCTRELEYQRAGPYPHGKKRAGRWMGQPDRKTDFQSGRSWENSGGHQPRIHLAGLPSLRPPGEALPVRTGVHLQGLWGVSEPRRECRQKYPGMVNAFVDSRWLSGACLSREAPPFWAGVVHMHRMYSKAGRSVSWGSFRGCNSRMQGGEGELAQGVERKWFGNGTRPSTNGRHSRRTHS